MKTFSAAALFPLIFAATSCDKVKDVAAGAANEVERSEAGRMLAPPMRPKAAAVPDRSRAEIGRAQDYLAQLRSQCLDAGWALWHSNDYTDWRKDRGMLTIHYMSRDFSREFPIPTALPEEFAERWKKLVPPAVENLQTATPVFQQLANYVNARDFEDDKFKKGDELNAKLITAGKTGYAHAKELGALHADIGMWILRNAENQEKHGTLAKQLLADLALARSLADELAKGTAAGRTKVEEISAAFSKMAEERAATLPAGGKQDLVRDFYSRQITEIAVETRKNLRESKGNAKKWAAQLEDRPRSFADGIRSDVDISLIGRACDALE